MTNRAYSFLEIKSVDDEKRIIRGVATTPTPDRVGDIVEPLGVSFKNPMPLLWQHKSDKPIGTVKFDKPTKDGINFEAQLPTPTESPDLIARVSEAWESVKLGLVRAVSIGFRALEYSFMDDGGIRFMSTEVMELSLVTIPAQSDATIQSIKSIDAPLLAATGKEPKASDRPTPPAPGKKSNPIVKAQEGKTMAKKTIAEQIAAFEATRQAKSARRDELQTKASDEGRTKDAAEKEEFDTITAELKSIDDELIDLREMEESNKKTAIVVKDVQNSDDWSRARGGGSGVRVDMLKRDLPLGIGFTRYVLAYARAKGNIMHAVEIAKANEQWMAETPEVAAILKVAVTPGSTTDSVWAGPLVQYQVLASAFIEYLRPLTIIGRLQGLTRVPFNVKIQRQTGASTVNWVGQGAPKPLTSLAFDTLTLDIAKIAGIIVLNQELVRLSNPSAELLVRNDLAKSIVQFMDNQFVDPTKAAVATVSPASITNGVTPVTATGTTGAALRADVKTLFASFLTNNMQVSEVSWIMTQQSALGISMMTNSLGQKEFPGISMAGGEFVGLPVVTSENVPSTGGSPTDGFPLILVSTPDILLADDGDVTIDMSSEASLQMDTAPDSPATASTTMISLFQQNQIAIRAERFVNWAKRRSTAVAFIQNAKYFE